MFKCKFKMSGKTGYIHKNDFELSILHSLDDYSKILLI